MQGRDALIVSNKRRKVHDETRCQIRCYRPASRRRRIRDIRDILCYAGGVYDGRQFTAYRPGCLAVRARVASQSLGALCSQLGLGWRLLRLGAPLGLASLWLGLAPLGLASVGLAPVGVIFASLR